jgi:hypothetical protein
MNQLNYEFHPDAIARNKMLSQMLLRQSATHGITKSAAVEKQPRASDQPPEGNAKPRLS